MSLVLVVDTAIQGVAAALVDVGCDGPQVLHTVYEPSMRKSAESLPSAVERLFQHTVSEGRKIDYYVVGCGPGSFTGIKVGIAFVQGFLAGGEVGIDNCAGVSSLKAISRLSGNIKLTIVRATRSAGYGVLHSGDASEFLVVQLNPDGSVAYKGLDGAVRPIDLEPKFMQVVGPWPELSSLVGEGLLEFNYEHRVSDVLLAMAQESLENQVFLGSLGLEPLYLRRSAPEEQRYESQQS